MLENDNGVMLQQEPKDKKIVVFSEGEDINTFMDLQVKSRPKMPIHRLPAVIQEIIAEYQKINFNPEYLSGAVIAATSVAIGNSYYVSPYKMWTESALVYMAIVGSPGTGKTQPLFQIFKPIQDKDTGAFHTYEKEVKEFKQWERDKKDKKDIPLKEYPSLKRIIVSDITPESLVEKLKINPRGIARVADELAAWVKNFNRYSKGSEEETWLSIFSGSPISVDRKNSDPALIKKPFVSVVGTIQPSILKELGKDNKRDNGFLDRILFVFPEETKKAYWQGVQINEKICAKWTTIVNNIFQYNNYEDNNSIILYYQPAALSLLHEWQKKNTDRCNNEEGYAGIGAKIEIYAIRLSLIFQALFSSSENNSLSEIGIDAVIAATEFANYFADQSLLIQSIIKSDNPLDLLSQDKINFINQLPTVFTTQEAADIGKKNGLGEKTIQRLIRDNLKIFKKLSHGKYQIII